MKKAKPELNDWSRSEYKRSDLGNLVRGKYAKRIRPHNPSHPGEIIRKLCLEPLGLSVTRAAKALGVSRNTLSSLLKGETGVSPQMAVRLSIAFDTTAESWMNQQVQYDLWQARQHGDKLHVTRVAVKERLTA
jgi:addiction module HigA family antidote